MTELVVLDKETATGLVKRTLRTNEYILISENDKESLLKLKKRHSRGVKLLMESGDMYVKFGSLGSGKLDTILCMTCMVRAKRGGNSTFTYLCFFFISSKFCIFDVCS